MMEDALECGWVSVRPNAFEEKHKHKFVFIVAWNEIEGKLAVTCHDRTVQRRGGSAEPELGDSPPDSSWAGLFSFQELRAAHLQLCAVNSDLEPCLPAFPEEQTVWTVLFGAPDLSARDADSLCFQLQVYLGHALDTCGWRILSQVLFPDSDDSEEYYESLSELRQKGYKDALQRAKTNLQQLLEKQRGVERMVELLQLYAEQDEAYGDLVEATTELYHYLLQPFRDMRELAMLRRQQIKISLETERLGPRRVECLRREDEDWQRKAHTAVLSIQDLTVKYFETTARAQKVMYERMRADQRKFGKAAWGAAVEHVYVSPVVCMCVCVCVCLQMQGLQGGEEAMVRLDQLEAMYYELQLQLYETQFEILKYEELLLTAQLQSLRRQMSERQEEVVYYDTYESPDAMKATDDPSTPLTPPREDMAKLQQRTRQLEARRGRITAKKAYLKHKKEICIINHTQKQQQRQDGPEALLQDEEEEEEQQLSRVSQERQRTLDRLTTCRNYWTDSDPSDSLNHLRRPESFLSLPPMGGAVAEAPPPDAHASLPPARELLLLDSSTSPPLPPPPPPPPPSLEETPADASPVRSPLGPFTARFFDSSQLLNARKKLRKTASLESSQWRRASSPMDEVLASLKRGSFHLRKAELRVLAPDPDEDDDNNILAQIRKGVQLRKVRRQERSCRGVTASDPLTRSIHEALRRIKEASPESESESEDETPACTDWES
uniref:Junction-mediating and -regulatory protein-like n=1 Tax=Sinocyclocheilus rhinocerous TaxID=307959 RepID=A0A673IKF1_9TELE